jgi:4-oxalomesaconate tautomerase
MTALSCMWMRGGTSKGGYFLKSDLPQDVAARDAFLLRIMGSPDAVQIDGMGGADPLTSKVAVVSKSSHDGVDVDYLFLQVFVDKAVVTDAQNCGNILAGVGPFALERGIVKASGDESWVTIFMENTGQIAVATVQTPGGKVSYAGDARIDSRYRRVIVRRVAAKRQRARYDQRCCCHPHRQWDAVRGDARGRCWHYRL